MSIISKDRPIFASPLLGTDTPLFTFPAQPRDLYFAVLRKEDVPIWANEKEICIKGHKLNDLSIVAQKFMLHILQFDGLSFPLPAKVNPAEIRLATNEINEKAREALAHLKLPRDFALIKKIGPRLTISEASVRYIAHLEMDWRKKSQALDHKKEPAQQNDDFKQAQVGIVSPQVPSELAVLEPETLSAILFSSDDGSVAEQNVGGTKAKYPIKKAKAVFAKRKIEPDEARYFREAKKKTQRLSWEDEDRLARAWREHGDIEALHTIVNSQLLLVAKLAVKRSHLSGLPVMELIGEGNMGLSEAAKRFDPNKGFRLSTFARHYIDGAMKEFIMSSRSLVKLSNGADDRKLFNNLGRARAAIGASYENLLSPRDAMKVAEMLAVPFKKVVEMDQRLHACDFSLYQHVPSENFNDDEGGYIIEIVADKATQDEDHGAKLADMDEKKKHREFVAAGISTLTDRRDRDIFVRAFLHGQTHEEIGGVYRISPQRVNVIKRRAFEQVAQHARSLQAA